MPLHPKHRLPKQLHPRPERDLGWTLRTTRRRAERLGQLAAALGVCRPNGGMPTATAGSLLDALATGHLAVCRVDDPQKQLVWVGGAAAAAPDPRCPGEWDE